MNSGFSVTITQISLLILFVSAWVLFVGVFSLWVSLKNHEFIENFVTNLQYFNISCQREFSDKL